MPIVASLTGCVLFVRLSHASKCECDETIRNRREGLAFPLFCVGAGYFDGLANRGVAYIGGGGVGVWGDFVYLGSNETTRGVIPTTLCRAIWLNL